MDARSETHQPTKMVSSRRKTPLRSLRSLRKFVLNPRSLRSSLSLLKALLARAPRGSICLQISNSSPLFSVTRWANRFPLAYALFRDLRSVGHRIAETHERGLVYNGLDFETLAGGCRVASSEYQSRIAGIRNLRKDRPWSGAWDGLLFLEGFAAGAALDNRTSGPDTSKHTASASHDYTREVKG
jgi:hypothetical protein